jgi:YbbR domain-containing protein
VTRALRFLIHNWPLKLAAVALATLLYAGLVLSQNARVWPGPIAIQVVNQPTSAFILGTLPDVTNVRYFAPVPIADRLSSAAFAASVDLSTAEADGTQPFLANVQLKGPDGVTIIDWSPRQVYVRLDPLVTRTVPIRVNHGVVPEGLQLGDTEVSQSSVTVSGPESVVSQVMAAEARVRIQASGIDVDQLVDLVPVDGRGEVLSPVEMNPASIRVRIPVGSPVGTKTVPVTAVVTGTPGDGFEVASTTITPAVATVTGEADTLAGLTSVQTKPVDITGATTTLSQAAALDLPDGLSPVGDQAFTISVSFRSSASSRSFSAGLVIVGAEPNRTYTLGVDSVVVTLGGGDQALNEVDAASFAVSINVSALTTGSHDVDVFVLPPTGLKLLAVSPARVTVFVGDLSTPPPTPSPEPPSPSPTESPAPSASASESPVTAESPSPSPSPSPSI